MTECFRCGSPAVERFGGGHLCADCIPDASEETETADTRFDTSGDHQNPIDVADVTDEERAGMLREYLEAFVDAFGQVPRLMPLDEEGKGPIIQGECRLDSPQGREYLVDGEEAVRRIREEGARGFAIYAGKWDHGTEDALFVDHDDDSFPAPTGEPTLEVLSGSGQGPHETYRNAGDVANARVGDNLGEIRAENWYVVAPGSVHPTGGVYHVRKHRDIATLSDEDLDDSMRPASSRRDRDESESPVQDLDGEGDRPNDDTIDERLERAFANSHDGDRIQAVWNGRYRAAGFDDRSAAEFWLANRLDSWVARGDHTVVRQLLNRANLQKWPERPDDSYRDSVLSEVGHQDWYYDPDYEEGEDPEYSEDRHPLLEQAIATDGDVDAGAESTLPVGLLEALPLDERRRAARKRGLDWPSTEEARDRLLATIKEAMRNEDETVVDAPTALGKSHSIATTRWGVYDDVTGGKPVIHLSATRDARDEAAEAAAEHGGEYFVFESRHEACPVAAGDHDPREAREADADRQVITMDGEPASQWIDQQCEGKGLPFSAVHQHLADHNDQGAELPCCRGSSTTYDEDAGEFDDGEPAECPAIRQWDDWREGDYPLGIATHNFAHVPGLRMSTNVVIDEEPDFTQDLSKERIERAVSAYLRAADAPVATWESFIALATHDDWQGDAARERDQLRECLEYEPDREWYLEAEDAHTLAPALARAVFHAEQRGNGRRVGKTPHEPPRLDANVGEDDAWNRVWVTVTLDESNAVRTVRTAPDFTQTRSVIGLDAHPAEPVWSVNTVPHISTTEVLGREERRLWRRFERGLRVVQVGEATRPLASGEYFQPDQVQALASHLREEYGADFRTAISTVAVEDQLQDLLEDAGVASPGTMHYGEEKSRNDFGGEGVGLVEGCIDPGDDYVLDLLAELELDAEPETVDVDGDQERAHGRGFEGPDADTAAAILASVRENHTAQAAGRYARDPEDPDSHATVYVRTDAMPAGFADVQVSGVEWTFSDLQSRIVDELRSATGAVTARELADAVDCSKEHARQVLERLADQGSVQAFAGGPNGAVLYADDGTPHGGVVDLEADDAIANSHVQDPYTWSLAIRDPTPTGEVLSTGATADQERETTVWDWRAGPDPGD